MRPVLQTRLAGETPGVSGNCLAACLATIVECEVEEVPQPPPPDTSWGAYYQDLSRWLLERGWVWFWYSAEGPAEWLPEPSRALPTIACGPGPRGVAHCVVWDNQADELIHDPHPSGESLTGVTRLLILAPIAFDVLGLEPRRVPFDVPESCPGEGCFSTDVEVVDLGDGAYDLHCNGCEEDYPMALGGREW